MSGTSESNILDRIGARRKGLPTLSTSISRILAALDSEDSDALSIGELMESDVGVASRILTVANSAFYNPSGMPLGCVGDAIARLGFDEVRHIVSTIGVIDAFGSIECPFDYRAFWRHSLTSAIAAGTLAQRSPRLELPTGLGRNPYFVAGLLHDVGIFVLQLAKGKRYAAMVEAAEADGVALDDAERDRFGFSHGEVGAALLRDWRLPEAVAIACEFHHSPARAPQAHRSWVQVVHLADWISDHEGLGLGIGGEDGRFHDGVWHDIGIDPHDIPDVIADFTAAASHSDLLLSVAG